MTPAEAQAIAAEQIAYWQARGWTAEMAWMALTGTYAERNGATWGQVSGFIVGWLIEHDPPAQLELRLAA